MKYPLLSILLLLQLSIHSQTLKGRVLDSITDEKLAYVNLVIKDKKIGVYSNENGDYNLDLTKTTTKDTLVVSLIGYESKKISLSRFIKPNEYTLNFQLVPKVESLDEILIVSKIKTYSNNKTQFSSGNRKQVFPVSVPFGYETAILIDNPKHKKGKLVELHLKYKDSNNDNYETYQTYYRLAFYNIDDLGFPGELLHFENIIIKPKKDSKNYKLSFEDKSIPFTEKGIFVGIATVQPGYIEIKNAMYLTTPSLLHTHTKNIQKYTRFRSNDWSKNSRKSVFKKKLYAVPFIKATVVYEKT
ncbi:carboxypeptidase-like regulatory domain-containing protein [Winogradskyella damuponensis]|uniref:Carboxypeptidase-like regulatory domain-containing protein n=1 Tax=Winogradskyella damuponensis TaxID=943939 RepID=A0ABP8CYV3_9FLAO